MGTMTATRISPIAERALQLHDAGFSLIPYANDGTKTPVGSWKRYQSERASRQQAFDWFERDGHWIGAINGAISGGLETVDIDDVPMVNEYLDLIRQQVGGRELLARLAIERTPSGCLHLCYRYDAPDGQYEGNQKLARRQVGWLDNGKPEIITLIETRGEGGARIAAPSPGYEMVSGDLANVPTISLEERQLLLDTARALNEYVEPEHVVNAPRMPSLSREGERPGDHYNRRMTGDDVADLVCSYGYTIRRRRGQVYDIARPGSDDGGHGATIGHGGTNLLYNFSSNDSTFNTEKAYPPFAVYTLLAHNGDWTTAAKELGKQGYGTPITPQAATSAVSAASQPTNEASDSDEFVGSTDGVQCLVELARIVELEQQLADRDAKIARLQMRLRMHDDERRVRRNPKLKAERDLIIEVAHAVTTLQERERRRAAAEGRAPRREVKLPAYKVLAERIGCSESKVSRDFKKIRDWRLVNARHETTLKPERQTPVGEYLPPGYVTETYVTLSDDPETWLTNMTDFEPDRFDPALGRERTHGGNRTRCEQHPHAAVTITETCSVCGEVLKRSTRKAEQDTYTQEDEKPIQTGDCNMHDLSSPKNAYKGIGQQDAISTLERRLAIRNVRPHLHHASSGAEPFHDLDERIVAAVVASPNPMDAGSIARAVGRQPRDVRPSIAYLEQRGRLRQWPDGMVTMPLAAVGGDD